jgi:hypothetical protein
MLIARLCISITRITISLRTCRSRSKRCLNRYGFLYYKYSVVDRCLSRCSIPLCKYQARVLYHTRSCPSQGLWCRQPAMYPTTMRRDRASPSLGSVQASARPTSLNATTPREQTHKDQYSRRPALFQRRRSNSEVKPTATALQTYLMPPALANVPRHPTNAPTYSPHLPNPRLLDI